VIIAQTAKASSSLFASLRLCNPFIWLSLVCLLATRAVLARDTNYQCCQATVNAGLS
jgi:hypothetical protein